MEHVSEKVLKQREYAKAYRERNSEKERERQRKVKENKRNSSREAYNAYMRSWNEKNKDRLNSERRDRLKNDKEFAEKSRLKDRERYAKAPEKRLASRLKSIYGISINEYRGMYKSQNGKCAICNKDYELGSNVGLAVDHCHKHGHVRGLLCTSCNNGLGRFEDNVEFLSNAIAYLIKYRKE